MKKFVLFLSVLFFITSNLAFAKNINGVWKNDLRRLAAKNNAIIYVINIRTFNAKDLNNNELIDNNEESGNFINAIDRLDELVKSGINTVHLLPITSIGKIKAFGTAGSLYAMSSFYNINPQLVSSQSSLSPHEQFARFVRECHNRNIRVIVDLPSCGAYDFFIEQPSLFLKDENNNPYIPLDWTDVRLFNSGNDKNINSDLLSQHKKFIDMLLSAKVDGIRADVAASKPALFWQELIKYTRSKNPDFYFMAESSKDWNKPISTAISSTPPEELLKAGFDSYLGSYFNLKDWKSSKDLTLTVMSDLKMFSKYKEPKTVIGSFSTHDEVSPILINGVKFSKMIIWLNATLPLNSYFVDGFATGDDYNYQWANKPADKSFTDDAYYFTHKGKLDIFNFSRKPQGKHSDIYDEFVLANKFKSYMINRLGVGEFIPLKTTSPKVFAYARTAKNCTIVVFGNLDFQNDEQVIIKVPKLNQHNRVTNMRLYTEPVNQYSKGKIKTNLGAGEIQVLLIKHLALR